jgi:molecular chaperone DnaK (HSP70)
MEEQLDNEYIVGIDLGTTSSCVAIWRNENVEVIPDEFGNKIIPSCVAYTNISHYVGHDAKNQRDLNPANMFYEVKRLIGRKIDDPIILCEKDFMSYDVAGDDKGNILLCSDFGKKFTPEEIQAMILMKLKQNASKYLKQNIKKAVITIPAYFNDGQRQATKDAAEIAGLECVRMINEPTAAGLSYGLYNKSITIEGKRTVLVYDFGGGTLDVTIMTIENGIFEVIASSGNTRLGGSDFDSRLMSFCMAKFKKQNNIPNYENLSRLSIQNLRTSCEQAKKLLSTNNKALVMVKNFYNNKDLVIFIKREDFENICGDLLMLALKPVDDILKLSELSISDINDVILVGGMTRIPIVRQLIKSRFNREPNCSINPEEAVVIGASIQAFMISNVEDPFSNSITLVNKTALSLGVETMGGVMDVLIPRESIIPVKETKMYTTCDDFVDTVTVKIYEGERSLTKDNFFVGEFDLSGLEKNPRGFAEIEVTFKIDENAIINVSAENITKDETHNTKSSIIVNCNKNRLSREEIERLVEVAKEEEFKDELEKRLKLFHYQIDDFCSNILVNIRRDDFKLSQKDKDVIEGDILKYVKWLKEKKYSERTDDEYERVSDKVKSQYGVLILKSNITDNSNIKPAEGEKIATNIYNDDNDEEKQLLFQEENKGMEDPDATEIKELKSNVNNLCYTINEIIHSSQLTIDESDKKNLMYYIDDTLLWLITKQNLTKIDLKAKIDEINENCDKITNYYSLQNKEIFVGIIDNKMQELEELCLSLKVLFCTDNSVPIINKLKELILKTLEEIYNDGIKIEQCENRINEINNLCDEIHAQSVFRKPNDTDILLSGYNEKETTDNKPAETDIVSMIKERQQKIIDDLINKEE